MSRIWHHRRGQATRPLESVAKLVLVAGLALFSSLRSSPAQGWSPDPFTAFPVCAQPNSQITPVMISDGADGFILAWTDGRAGTNFDVYVQRLDNWGHPRWGANGLAVGTASGDQQSPVVLSDGAGGVFVAWIDSRNGFYDIYAQRVNASGVAQWTANGVPVCTATFEQYNPTLASDGAGGLIVTWFDFRGGATADIYSQRLNGSGAAQWTANGVAVCTASNDQLDPVLVSDGAGGAIILWRDFRAALQGQVWAQRLNGSGVPQWTANGIEAFPSTTMTNELTAVSDGSGGVLAFWVEDVGFNADISLGRLLGSGASPWSFEMVSVEGASHVTAVADGVGGALFAFKESIYLNDIFARRVNGNGSLLWINTTCQATGTQDRPVIARTDSGAVVAWNDFRNTNCDVYAQRITSAGTSMWTTNGVPVSALATDQINPVVAWNPLRSQAVFAWEDSRNGAPDIYAQQVDYWMRVGDVSAHILSVSDVPNDQGGQVRIRWQRSFLDTLPTMNVSLYGIWRQVPSTALASAARAARAREERGGMPEARPGVFRVAGTAAAATYWEGVGTVPARADSVYTFVAPTLADSTGAGAANTTFMVDTHAAFVPGFWDSEPDSGHSVDNIAPAVPSGLAGAYVSGATQLTWNPNTEVDFAYFRLYRGTSSSFVPGPGNLIAALTGTAQSEAGPPVYFYKLSAVDAHGNESGFARLAPSGVTDVAGAGLPTEIAFGTPSPNPMGAGGVSLGFALPAAAEVTLEIFDVSGRLVRQVASGTFPAGRHPARWDGSDGSGGRVAAGLYFAQLWVGPEWFRRRVAVLR